MECVAQVAFDRITDDHQDLGIGYDSLCLTNETLRQPDVIRADIAGDSVASWRKQAVVPLAVFWLALDIVACPGPFLIGHVNVTSDIAEQRSVPLGSESLSEVSQLLDGRHPVTWT